MASARIDSEASEGDGPPLPLKTKAKPCRLPQSADAKKQARLRRREFWLQESLRDTSFWLYDVATAALCTADSAQGQPRVLVKGFGVSRDPWTIAKTSGIHVEIHTPESKTPFAVECSAAVLNTFFKRAANVSADKLPKTLKEWKGFVLEYKTEGKASKEEQKQTKRQGSGGGGGRYKHLAYFAADGTAHTLDELLPSGFRSSLSRAPYNTDVPKELLPQPAFPAPGAGAGAGSGSGSGSLSAGSRKRKRADPAAEEEKAIDLTLDEDGDFDVSAGAGEGKQAKEAEEDDEVEEIAEPPPKRQRKAKAGKKKPAAAAAEQKDQDGEGDVDMTVPASPAAASQSRERKSVGAGAGSGSGGGGGGEAEAAQPLALMPPAAEEKLPAPRVELIALLLWQHDPVGGGKQMFKFLSSAAKQAAASNRGFTLKIAQLVDGSDYFGAVHAALEASITLADPSSLDLSQPDTLLDNVGQTFAFNDQAAAADGTTEGQGKAERKDPHQQHALFARLGKSKVLIVSSSTLHVVEIKHKLRRPPSVCADPATDLLSLRPNIVFDRTQPVSRCSSQRQALRESVSGHIALCADNRMDIRSLDGGPQARSGLFVDDNGVALRAPPLGGAPIGQRVLCLEWPIGVDAKHQLHTLSDALCQRFDGLRPKETYRAFVVVPGTAFLSEEVKGLMVALGQTTNPKIELVEAWCSEGPCDGSNNVVCLGNEVASDVVVVMQLQMSHPTKAKTTKSKKERKAEKKQAKAAKKARQASKKESKKSNKSSKGSKGNKKKQPTSKQVTRALRTIKHCANLLRKAGLEA